MTTTTQSDCLAAAGAQFGEYAGAHTPVSFGAPPVELEALRSGSAVSDLAWRAKFVITGEDRLRWMNGVVTNNIRDLKPQRGNYSFILNAQGRIQGDATVYQRGDHILLETEAAQSQRLLEYFNKYIIMDDVEVSDVSQKLSTIGVAGPNAESTLQSAGLLPKALEDGEVVDENFHGAGYSVTRSVVEKLDGYEIWVAPQNFAALWARLVTAGARPAGSQALEWRRILAGIPRVGIDIGEKELPQETGQQHALHYAKGCYLGQEIVERIHSRGNVHRNFSAVEIEGAAPERGSKFMHAEKEVGEVTSAATIPIHHVLRTFALGFLRREAAAPGTELTVSNAAAKVVATPID